jgi:hypothetical protein
LRPDHLHCFLIERNKRFRAQPLSFAGNCARGQVTFRKKVMQHLGVKPGGKSELDLLPDGRGVIRAAKPAGTIDGFSVCLLAGQRKSRLSNKSMKLPLADGRAGNEADDRIKMATFSIQNLNRKHRPTFVSLWFVNFGSCSKHSGKKSATVR